MRESIVVICPTEQALTPATDWHDGQFAHGADAEIARRASACAAASRGRHSRERTQRMPVVTYRYTFGGGVASSS
jgi:hypothetical protein